VTLATLGTHDIGTKQNQTEPKKKRKKTNKQIEKTTTNKHTQNKKMRNTDKIKQTGVNPVAREG
jgi:hypothetical protein